MLHHVFRWLYPEDLFTLKGTCRMLKNYVDGNQKLCHDVYVHYLGPVGGPGSDWEAQRRGMDWEAQLRDVVWLERILGKKTAVEKERALAFVSGTVDQLLQNACSQGYPTENSNSHCESRTRGLLAFWFGIHSNQEAFLQRSFLFERVRKEHHCPIRFPDAPKPEHQLSAKLHCLYGQPILNLGRLRSTRTYPFAVSKVYDLRQYTDQTRWGPFMNDSSGRVDWEKMEAILIVLGYNLHVKRISKLFSDVWESPFSGSWPRSFLASSQTCASALDARDPYGVTGTWYRVSRLAPKSDASHKEGTNIVCFLDYNDFFGYNFPVGNDIPHYAPRQPLSVGEATRLIIMRIHVTSIEPPGPDDGQELPVVHFSGVSRSLDDSWDDNANSNLQGTVRLTREGEVHWTSTSIFHGEERWKSEGIQIGGVGSARGVLGNWFDKDYDVHGPAGPTAFWKASESEATADTMHDVLNNDFLVTYNTIAYMEDSDPEAEMDYEDDEDEEYVDENIEAEPVADELPGLLRDAQLEVAEVVFEQQQQQ
ncbi:hypothetical protein CDD82_4283 [Ophiocordyceps australis]|uniref:F-box domain-containing protein n=1 Tax=Ophiocordyceps australis TaxID=1399860 RepID=A0A2C5Z1V6_9HYPO|nr:hypothetical protein CDD82_4283 [Ophiocordyceps australis]